MTRIILTRHGHVDWIAPERFRGRAELPLSPLGEKQAAALGQRIAQSWKPDFIYTSPLSRCVRTGEAVAKATIGISQVLQDFLADIDYGQWQGLTHDEVRAKWPEEARLWFNAPDMAAIPGGELLADVLVRAIRVLQFLSRQHQDQTIVLVGHDSFNRVLLLHALGLPLSHYWRIKQEPCCVNELELRHEAFTVHCLNESHHTLGLEG